MTKPNDATYTDNEAIAVAMNMMIIRGLDGKNKNLEVIFLFLFTLSFQSHGCKPLATVLVQYFLSKRKKFVVVNSGSCRQDIKNCGIYEKSVDNTADC